MDVYQVVALSNPRRSIGFQPGLLLLLLPTINGAFSAVHSCVVGVWADVARLMFGSHTQNDTTGLLNDASTVLKLVLTRAGAMRHQADTHKK